MIYGRPGLSFTYLSRGVLLRARGSHFRRHTTRLSYDRRRTTNRSKGHPSRSWIDLSRSPDLHVTGVAQSPSNLVYIPTNCKDPDLGLANAQVWSKPSTVNAECLALILPAQACTRRDQVQSARLVGLLGWACPRYATIARNAAGVRTQLRSTVGVFFFSPSFFYFILFFLIFFILFFSPSFFFPFPMASFFPSFLSKSFISLPLFFHFFYL